MKKCRFLMAYLIVALLLAACNNQAVLTSEELSADGTIFVNDHQIAVLEESDSGGNYYALQDGMGPANIRFAVVLGNSIYYIVMTPEDITRYKLQNDSSEVIYATNGMVVAATASENGIWTCEVSRNDGKNNMYLNLIAHNGEILRTLDLDTLYENGLYVSSIRYASGMLYLFCRDTLIILSDVGEQVCSIKLPEMGNSYLLSGHGEVYIAQTSDNGNDIFALDIPSSSLVMRFSTEKGNLYDGHDDYLFFLKTNYCLRGVQNDGASEELIIWEESYLSIGNLEQLIPQSEREFKCLIDSVIYELIPVEYNDVKLKTRLTIAAIGSTEASQASVSRFNSKNEDYYIEIVDYSVDGGFTHEQAISKLNVDLITENCPDMIIFNNLSPYLYIRKGHLVDMNSYLENDDEINEDDLVISNALEMSGGIYLISDRFFYETVAGLRSDFGERYGWTLSEYLEIERTMPTYVETLYNTTKNQFLRKISARYLGKAINWETGSCDFNNDEFIEILEASNRIKESPEDLNNMDFTYGAVRVSNGTLVAAAVWGDSIWKLAFEEKMAGCELSFIGWPTVDGSSGSDIHISEPLGIVSQSSNADGCWEYIKFMLMESNENFEAQGAIPIYLPVLKNLIENLKSDKTIPIAFTDADAEEFYDLLSAIENIAIYDETVLEIISVEGAALFNGDKSASEVAKIIQSRVSIYVAEQR